MKWWLVVQGGMFVNTQGQLPFSGLLFNKREPPAPKRSSILAYFLVRAQNIIGVLLRDVLG